MTSCGVMVKGLAAAVALLGLGSLWAGIHDEPDGVQVQMAANGSYKIIAVGTGTYDFDDPDDILDARKEAERNAKAAIAKFMKEDLATEESAQNANIKIKRIQSDGENETTAVDKTSIKTTVESIRSSSSALLKGVVVLADEKVPSGKGGTYRVMVGVSSTTIKAADPIASSPAGGTPPVAQSPSSVGNPPAANASGLPEGWTVCVGVGSDRKGAVQAALIEGISQIYGQVLQNDERQRERSVKLKTMAVVDGEEKSATGKASIKVTQSETLTKTGGFVREYRIVKVDPKDGNLEATVYANIVNPRAGGTVALMICRPKMTIEDKTTVYQLGPDRRLSGAEVAKEVQRALPLGLLKNPECKFMILNDLSLEAVVENKAMAEAMVATGMAGNQELMQAGQGLTPDYSLRSEIKEIKYSKKLGQDKKTKKFGQQSKLAVKLDITLTNDRNGQVVKADSLTVSLDNEEIKTLLEADEDADLLRAALGKLVKPIEEWIGDGK